MDLRFRCHMPLSTVHAVAYAAESKPTRYHLLSIIYCHKVSSLLLLARLEMYVFHREALLHRVLFSRRPMRFVERGHVDQILITHTHTTAPIGVRPSEPHCVCVWKKRLRTLSLSRIMCVCENQRRTQTRGIAIEYATPLRSAHLSLSITHAITAKTTQHSESEGVSTTTRDFHHERTKQQ